MINAGIRASELIEKLEKMIKKHGDRMVFAGGGDYPDGVESVILKRRNDPYVPKGSFYIL